MIGMQTELEYQMGDDFLLVLHVLDLMFRKATFHPTNRSASQRNSMSSPSRVLRLWQLQRKMLLRSLIIVKIKRYVIRSKQGTKAYEYIKSILDAEFEEHKAYMKRVEEAVGFKFENIRAISLTVLSQESTRLLLYGFLLSVTIR